MKSNQEGGFKNFEQLKQAFQLGANLSAEATDKIDVEIMLALELGRAFGLPGSPTPIYPTALMYRQNGLYYYAGRCCVGTMRNQHPGKIVSNVALPTGCPVMGSGGGPAIEGSELNLGDEGIPHGVGTRKGLAFGMYIDSNPGNFVSIPLEGDIADVSGIVDPPFSVVDYQNAGLKSLTWAGFHIFGNNIGFRIKLVTDSTITLRPHKYLAAHAVTVESADALDAVPLLGFKTPPDNSQMLAPYLGRVDDPANGNETLDIAITFYP